MQHMAVHLLKTPWAPSNSWNFYTKHIVPLDQFCCHCRRLCCHCRRCLYLSAIGYCICAESYRV